MPIAPLPLISEFRGSIPAYFERVVAQAPDKPAIESQGISLTYAELDAKSNQIANNILNRIDPGAKPVAILEESPIDRIVSLLGVLKAGRSYIPLEPSDPESRNRFILNDSEMCLILVDSDHPPVGIYDRPNRKILDVRKVEGNDSRSSLEIAPEDVAFIMYTSGSTGKPKGTIQTHINLLQTAYRHTWGLSQTADDRVCSTVPFTYAMSTLDVFGTLLTGGTLFPFDLKSEGIIRFSECLIEDKVTIYQTVPTVFRLLMNNLDGNEVFPSLRIVKFGGEPLYSNDVNLCRNRLGDSISILNGLGSSELLSTRKYLIKPNTEINAGPIPVGYATPGVEVVLINDEGEEVASGKTGQIVLRSKYITPGYWNRDDLNRQVFKPDPMDEAYRLFYTGDMGCLEPDGCLVYHGRRDSQVKVRGCRVEVGEVESVMSLIDGLVDVAVTTERSIDNDTELVAHCVTETKSSHTNESIRRELKDSLPDVMIPSRIEFMTEIPRTSTGKIDRGKLSRPELLRPIWKKSTPTLNAGQQPLTTKNTGGWLIFGDGSELESNLIEEIKKSGGIVSVVYIDTNYTKRPDNYFTINPGSKDDYHRLVTNLLSEEKRIDRVLHLWSRGSLQHTSESVYDPESPLEEEYDRCYFSLIHIAEALATRGIHSQITVISDEVFKITESDPVSPIKGLLLGPVNVIPLEYPHISSRCIDVDKLSEHILCAGLSSDSPTQYIAYRNGQRWVRSITPIVSENNASTKCAFKRNGTYLITGGLGGIGLEFAMILAHRYQANLVLTGRSTLPPENEWDEITDNRLSDISTISTISMLQDIRQAGSELTILEADVCDIDRMRQVIQETSHRFGTINGIIHTAGVVGGESMAAKDRADVKQVLRPKVVGLLSLETLISEMNIDFLILCSSLTAIKGRIGQADYCAANSFLDHFAQSKSDQSNLQVLSINWDTWAEVGMFVKAADAGVTLLDDDRLTSGLSNVQGTVSLEKALQTGESQVIVTNRQISDIVDLSEIEISSAAIEQLPQGSTETKDANSKHTPILSDESVSLKDKLISIWEKVLQVQPVNTHDDFFDLGGNSIMAIQLTSMINEATGIALPITTLTQASTVSKMEVVLTQKEKISRTSSLVPIKPEGSNTPLFLIHSIAGHVMGYKILAGLMHEDQPIFGIQARGIDGDAEPFGNLTEMAEHYIGEIKKVQPQGPYMVGGYSGGGIIAFEMAQQLRMQGDEVALLVMIDSMGPDLPRATAHNSRIGRVLWGIRMRTKSHWYNIESLSLKEKIYYLLQHYRGGIWRVQKDIPASLQRVSIATEKAVKTVVSRKLDSRMVLFRVKHQLNSRISDPKLGWGKCAGRGLEVHELPGSHRHLLGGTRTALLAEKLQTCIDESQAVINSSS